MFKDNTYCEKYYKLIIDTLSSKWEIIKHTFEYIPLDVKYKILDDYKKTLDLINFKKLPSSYSRSQKIFLIILIKCFENNEFISKVISNPNDSYFSKFDDMLTKYKNMAIVDYSFLKIPTPPKNFGVDNGILLNYQEKVFRHLFNLKMD